jgi:transcription elongation factor Elf1
MRVNVEIKCPECGSEHVRPCTRLDEYSQEWIDTSCETCGHKLSFDEIGRQVVNQMRALLAFGPLGILAAPFSNSSR